MGRPGEGALSDGFPGITTKAALPSTQLLTEQYELSMGEKKNSRRGKKKKKKGRGNVNHSG